MTDKKLWIAYGPYKINNIVNYINIDNPVYFYAYPTKTTSKPPLHILKGLLAKRINLSQAYSSYISVNKMTVKEVVQ